MKDKKRKDERGIERERLKGRDRQVDGEVETRDL